MQKIIIWTLLILALSSLALATECQRETSVTNIPCNLISSWTPSSCLANVSIYNSSGYNIVNYTWGNYNIVCNFTFNITQLGTYNYNSSIESGVITIVGDNEMILAFLLIPLGLVFIFIYWGQTLNEDQEPLKWFMRLLALVFIFVTYGGANIAISMNQYYLPFLSIFDIWIYGVIFFAIMAVFLVYFLYKLGMSMKLKRGEDLERGNFR